MNSKNGSHPPAPIRLISLDVDGTLFRANKTVGKRTVEVIRPIETRVGAAVATTCYVDHSPAVVPEAGQAMILVRGEGRPSKRLRRELERLRRAPGA